MNHLALDILIATRTMNEEGCVLEDDWLWFLATTDIIVSSPEIVEEGAAPELESKSVVNKLRLFIEHYKLNQIQFSQPLHDTAPELLRRWSGQGDKRTEEQQKMSGKVKIGTDDDQESNLLCSFALSPSENSTRGWNYNRWPNFPPIPSLPFLGLFS